MSSGNRGVSVVSLLDDDGNINLMDTDETESLTAFPESDFVKTVGLVEDIFVGEDFQTWHSDYFTKHCSQFSTGTDPPLGSAELEKLTKQRFNIFRTYSVETAVFLEKELKRSLGEAFGIDKFIQEIERRAKLAESSMAEENVKSSGSTSPRTLEAHASGEANQAPITDITEVMGGEIFEMLLTLKDYARFQELMVDYLQMIQGTTPDIKGLVSLRHLSDDENGDQ